ncbi:MAG: hypothetical protein AB1938_20035 [Myxococcota bacterium]
MPNSDARVRPLVLVCLIATASVAGHDGGTLTPPHTTGIGKVGSMGRVEACAKRVHVDDATIRCDDPPAPREVKLQGCVRTAVTQTKTTLTLICETDAGVTRTVTLSDPKMGGGYGQGFGTGKPKTPRK